MRIEPVHSGPDDVTAFAATFGDRAVLPGDPRYESRRRVWNGMIDRNPLVIVGCKDAGDIVACLEFAGDRGYPAAVRGGGHSVAGHGTVDAGLVIDLSAMKAISVDPDNRTADAGPGLNWGEFDAATQRHGLATTGGLISTTGIAGLTLGGGIGWLARKCGLSCDNLIEADVVTVDGTVLRAAADENADLYWALRGGGGNFGVVTRFRYSLHRHGPEVLCGTLVFDRDCGPDVLRNFRDVMDVAPDELAAYATIGVRPDWQPVVTLTVHFAGRSVLGGTWIERLRDCGAVEIDTIAVRPYMEFQSFMDGAQSAGRRAYWRSSYLDGLGDEAIAVALDCATFLPAVDAIVNIERYGGAASRVAIGETAFPNRDGEYLLNVMSVWDDASADDANIGWVKRCWEAMAPHSQQRSYVNFLGDEGQSRVREAYGPNFNQLASIKAKYDPANVLRVNQNIMPTAPLAMGQPPKRARTDHE